MTHIENVPHILQFGITHKNSPNANLDYVAIGDDLLTLVSDGYETVKSDIENNAELAQIAQNTTRFLTDFYSDR
jgi:hypothetical protein